jgi:hypothetical protein
MYPVFVDTTFQGGLGVDDLLWVWWGVIAHVGVLADAFHIGRVCGLTSFGQDTEIIQYIVLCMRSNPVSASG